MRDIKGFDPPEPELICPMRKSGGPCVEGGCAWWWEECSVLSIAKSLFNIEGTLSNMVPEEEEGMPLATIQGKPWHPIVGGVVDEDDVPF